MAKQSLVELKWQTLLNKLALGAIRLIKKRTREGKSARGETFRPYHGLNKGGGIASRHTGYARKRERAGLPVHPVDLTWDDINGMMAQMDHDVLDDNRTAEIFFATKVKERLALFHTKLGAGRSKKLRPFFEITDEEGNKLMKLAEDTALTLAEQMTVEQIRKMVDVENLKVN